MANPSVYRWGTAASGAIGSQSSIPTGGTTSTILNDGLTSTYVGTAHATFPDHRATVGLQWRDENGDAENVSVTSWQATIRCWQDSGGGSASWALHRNDKDGGGWVLVANGALVIDTAATYNNALDATLSGNLSGTLASDLRLTLYFPGAANAGVAVSEFTAYRAGVAACTPPQTPGNVRWNGLAEGDEWTVEWNLSVGATGYLVKIDGEDEIDVGNVLSYTKTSATVGQTYEVQVAAYNSCGRSPYSSILSVTPEYPCDWGDDATIAVAPVDVDVRLYNSDGERILVDPAAVDSVSWSVVDAGGMDQATVIFSELFDSGRDFGGASLKVFVIGESTPRWIGSIEMPEDALDMHEVRRLQAFGRMSDMNRVVLNKVLYPGGTGADISWFISQLLDDYQARRPGLTFSRAIEVCDVELERLECSPSTIRDAIDRIVANAGTRVVWGWDVDPTDGSERFFLKKRTTTVAYQYWVGEHIKTFGMSSERQGIANAAFVRGGPARYPQLLTNPSFEQLIEPNAATGNLLTNGGFELGTGWTYINGASRKQQSGGSQPASAHSGSYYLELDNNNEEAYQAVAVDRDTPYRLALFMRREVGSYANTGQVIIEGRAGATGTVQETYTLDLAPSSVAWTGGQGTTILSGDGTDFVVTFTNASTTHARVRLKSTNGTTGSGLLVDDVTFAKVGAAGQTGWSTHLQHDSSNDNVIHWVDWASRGAAYEGFYGVRISVTCDTSHRTYIGPYPPKNDGKTPGYHATITPQQSLYGFYYVRMAPGYNSADGQVRVEFRGWKSDGSQTQTQYEDSVTIPDDGTWVKVDATIEADTDIATGEIQIAFEADGVYDVDAASLRDSASDHDEYLPSQNFERYVTAEQVCDSGTPAYDSFDTYGRQEAILQNTDIVDWNSAARGAVKAYFEEWAIPRKRPLLHIHNDPVNRPDPSTGSMLRVSGLAQNQDPFNIAKTQYTWAKSVISIQLDLNRERPTPAKLLRQRGLSQVSGGGVASSISSVTRSQNPPTSPGGTFPGITLKNDGSAVTNGTGVNTLNILGSLLVTASDNGDETSTGTIALGPTLEGLEAISSSAGLVEQTSTPDTFAIRSIGVGSGSSIPDRDAADSRYVRSVGVSVPAALLAVSGTPVTSVGTIAITLATQAARTALLGPASGGDATPAFRLIKANDLESVSGGVLFGRYAGSAGAGQEITIGSGLTLDTGTGVLSNTGAGSGTVASVALAAPAEFTVSGSPVTTSGTLTLTKASQSANRVWASPDGSAGAPTFRALVAADIPSLPYVTSVALSVPSILSVSGSPITSSGTLAVSLANQSGNTVFASPSNGSSGTPAFRSLVAADIPALAYVTSVALSAPSEITVGGSPITSSGTLALSWANQTQNKVFASPNGSTGVPTFRALVAGDIPSLAYVTSIGLSLPAEFTVSGSPVTSSGTLTATKASQSANTVWAAPNGSAGAPTFRSLVAADIPSLSYVTSVGLSAPAFLSVSGSPVTSSGTLALSLANQSANLFFAGPASGSATAPTFRSMVPADLPQLITPAQITADQHDYAPTGHATALGMILESNAQYTITGIAGGVDKRPLLLVNRGLYNIVLADDSSGSTAANRISLPSALTLVPSSGTWLVYDGTAQRWFLASPWFTEQYTGTVTSVGLSLPAIFSVSGSPVTGSGTLSATLASQSANTVWAAPNGSAGAPTFRALVAADIPQLAISKIDSSAGSRLFGRYTGSAGAGQEISIGTGLALDTGTGVLSSTITGTVTSVALSAPSEISVSGSPVTTSGTLALTWANQTQNKVFASPNGSTGTPAFRALVAADIPALSYVTSVGLSAPAIFSVGGSPVTSSGTLALSLATQVANRVWSGPSSGADATPTFRALVSDDIPSLAISKISAAAGSRLFGRYAGTSGAGQEISLGSGLSLDTGTGVLTATGTGGTVTSVGLSLPTIFSVSGSPVTSSGTLTATLASQSANLIWASPNGSAGAPTFRALVAADIPQLTAAKIDSSAGSRLFGRYTGSAGAGQEISIGTGLSLNTGTGVLSSTVTGTVTSVALSAPAEISVSGSPVTTSGTLALSWASQTQNKVFASPNGSTGTPGFRALVAADIPSLSYVTSVGLSAPAIFSVSGSPVTSSGTLALSLANQNANLVWAGPTTGLAAAPTFRSLVAADIPALAYVTSVALSAPAEFTVSGSPITSSGTLTLTKASQTQNTVWAAPNGSAGAPTFRALVAADIPALAYVTSVGLSLPSIFSVSGSPVTSSGTLTATLASQSGNVVFASPSNGSSGAPAFRALVAADLPQHAISKIDAANGARLFGRYSATAGAGQEISLGGNMTLDSVTGILDAVVPAPGVTSVALSAPAIFTVSGSPITSTGTLTFSLASQSANLVWASPNGSAGAPTFRALVVGDLANDLVTYAKIQNVSVTDRLLGRDTAGAGDIEELTVSGGIEFTGSGGIQRSALTGDVTASAGSNTTTIAARAVTVAKFQAITDNRLLGRSAGSDGDMMHITVSSPLTLSSGALGFDQSLALGNVARTTVRKNTGVDVGSRRRLNFIEGSNITLTIADDNASEEIDITIAASGGGSGYATIQEEGSSLTARATMNFIGINVTAADNAGSSRTDVTVISPFNLERPTTATTDFTRERLVVFEDTGGGTSYDFTAQGVYHVVNRRSATNITVGAAGSFTLVGGSLTLYPGQDCRVVAFSYGGAGNVAYRLDDSPGGSDGHIQYKKGAGNAGEAGFEYDETNNQATIPGLTVTQDVALSGDITPAQITSNQNDYAPTDNATTTRWRLSSDAARTITGIAGGADGRILILSNVGSYPITLADDADTSSSAANRLDLGGTDFRIAPSQTIFLVYDSTLSRWTLLDTPARVHYLEYTAAGTTSNIPIPTWATKMHRIVVGGGGGGGGGARNDSAGANCTGGGGGTGGGVVNTHSDDVAGLLAVATTISVTVGSGGTGGAGATSGAGAAGSGGSGGGASYITHNAKRIVEAVGGNAGGGGQNGATGGSGGTALSTNQAYNQWSSNVGANGGSGNSAGSNGVNNANNPGPGGGGGSLGSGDVTKDGGDGGLGQLTNGGGARTKAVGGSGNGDAGDAASTSNFLRGQLGDGGAGGASHAAGVGGAGGAGFRGGGGGGGGAGRGGNGGQGGAGGDGYVLITFTK